MFDVFRDEHCRSCVNSTYVLYKANTKIVIIPHGIRLDKGNRTQRFLGNTCLSTALLPPFELDAESSGHRTVSMCDVQERRIHYLLKATKHRGHIEQSACVASSGIVPRSHAYRQNHNVVAALLYWHSESESAWVASNTNTQFLQWVPFAGHVALHPSLNPPRDSSRQHRADHRPPYLSTHEGELPAFEGLHWREGTTGGKMQQINAAFIRAMINRHVYYSTSSVTFSVA